MWNQPPAKASFVVGGFFRYPAMTVLPRTMTSPMVSPSAGTGSMVSASAIMSSPRVG